MARARIDGVSISTDGSIASPPNGASGFSAGSGAFQDGTDDHTLIARLAFNTNADTAADSVREETGLFSFTLTFTVDEPAPYRLTFDGSMLAELRRHAQSATCDGSAAFSGLLADSNIPLANGSLGFGPLLVLDDGGDDAANEYRASGHGSLIGIPAGAPVTHVITFTATAALRSAGCAMSVRAGEPNGTTLDCPVCNYPGDPARDIAADGVVVRFTVSALCGDGHVDTAVGEECDLGARNGTSDTCCTALCRLRTAGEACTADDNVCTDDLCDGSAAECAHVANQHGCDDGLFCNGADGCADGSCAVHAGSPCPGPDGDADCRESCDEARRACDAPDAVGSACAADASGCTDDVCDAGGDCTHPARSGACDDGDACTLNDRCEAGICQPGVPACDACQTCALDGTCGGAACTPLPTPTPTPGPCAGDCSGDGRVGIDEVVRLVGLALANGDALACSRGDANGDRRISIDEIVAAVGSALSGC